jgi:protein-disulfide isomerase
MSDSSNPVSKIVLALVLLVLAGGAAYYFLHGKSDYAEPSPTPVTAETTPTAQPEVVTEQTPAPTQAQEPVVVQTKTLSLPPATTQIPSGPVSANPEVEMMMGLRTEGSNDAPIKVVEYSSLTCGHCSAFHKDHYPAIKQKYIDTGKVQFIFKEFPLNKPAIDASKLLRCMPADKFVPFQSLLFSEQDKWAYTAEYLTPLKQNAKLAGLSDEKIESCLNNKDLENRIIGDMQEASEKFQIQSTPTFIINNGVRVIVGHQQLSVFEEAFEGILSGKYPPPGMVPPMVPPTETVPAVTNPVSATPTPAAPAVETPVKE